MASLIPNVSGGMPSSFIGDRKLRPLVVDDAIVEREQLIGQIVERAAEVVERIPDNRGKSSTRMAGTFSARLMKLKLAVRVHAKLGPDAHPIRLSMNEVSYRSGVHLRSAELHAAPIQRGAHRPTLDSDAG